MTKTIVLFLASEQRYVYNRTLWRSLSNAAGKNLQVGVHAEKVAILRVLRQGVPGGNADGVDMVAQPRTNGCGNVLHAGTKAGIAHCCFCFCGWLLLWPRDGAAAAVIVGFHFLHHYSLEYSSSRDYYDGNPPRAPPTARAGAVPR